MTSENVSNGRPAAIRLRGFVKRFGSLTAVDGLDLEVPYGTCVGLLGPNGAGKSTTMKALTAQVIPDAGHLEVLGYRLPADSKQARAEMGVVPQLDNLDVSLTVEQNLLVFAHLYRVAGRDRAAAIDRALAIANLRERREAKVDELSGGMRRRLLIARALLHRPRLMLLDEPTVGLDPQVRQELWALIDSLRSEGVSILMSTHYIEEAERLCDSVTIVSHGKTVAVGPPGRLIHEHAGREAVEVFGPPGRLSEVEQLARERGWRTRRTGTSVAVLNANGSGELDGDRRLTNLEDVFVLLTGEALWIACRTGVYGCVPMLVAVAFGLHPSPGMLLVPFIAALAGYGWATFGIFIAARVSKIESFSYWQSGLLTPMFLVAGTFFPLSSLPRWAQVAGSFNPLFHCVQLVRHAVFGQLGWVDVAHVAFLVGFALIAWRLAIRFMERKLVT